jgi:hypothetical protein
MKIEKIKDKDIMDSWVWEPLVDTFKGEKQFSGIARSDEAFSVLPVGMVESLLGLEPVDWREKLRIRGDS